MICPQFFKFGYKVVDLVGAGTTANTSLNDLASTLVFIDFVLHQVHVASHALVLLLELSHAFVQVFDFLFRWELQLANCLFQLLKF